jgi:hypothetical protein
VVNDEGLRSRKAIAFIQNKGNPKNTCLSTKTYFTARRVPQDAERFSKQEKRVELGLYVSLNEKLGDLEWKK